MANSYSETSQYTPEQIILLNEYSSHHLLLAEKSTHKLFLFKNNNGIPQLLKTYQMATGKKSGNKLFQGDHRTPEGIYEMTSFIPYQELIKRHGEEGKIYGVGAFVLNYPNSVDQNLSKTGGGIWLHSTNDETRIEKGLDSRGCVVVANNDLQDLSKYIELDKTPILITHQIKFLNQESYLLIKQELTNFIDTWLNAWINEDIEKYLSHYHTENFSDKFRGKYNEFAQYKKSVFSNPGAPSIKIKHITILQSKTYALISFVQNYKSNTIDDTGKKTLYLQKDEFYNWKIINESWSKLDNQQMAEADQMAFEPTMRFFQTEI